jgi:hypothetical protein
VQYVMNSNLCAFGRDHMVEHILIEGQISIKISKDNTEISYRLAL